MPLLQQTVSLVHPQGLHARPAALFVQRASRFGSRVTLKKGRKSVDGKSIMGLLTLAARQGARISLVVDGPDAREALEQLSLFLTEPLPASPQPLTHHRHHP
jgi:phosphocarrier protein